MSKQLEPGIWWNKEIKSYMLAMPIQTKSEYSDGENLQFYWLNREWERMESPIIPLGYQSGHGAEHWREKCETELLNLVVSHEDLAIFFDLLFEIAEENKDET